MEKEIISTKNLTLTPINGEVTISLLEIDRLRQEAATWAKVARELENKQMEVKIEVYTSDQERSYYDERRMTWIYNDVKNIKSIEYINLEDIRNKIRQEEVVKLEKTIKQSEQDAKESKVRLENANKLMKDYLNQAQNANDKYGKLIGDHEKLKKDYEHHCEISENHTKMHNELANKYFILRSNFDHLQKVTTIKQLMKNYFSGLFKTKINLKK